MIKYNNNNINDWYYDSNDIAKVYYNGNVTYQRVWVSPIQDPHQPCYDVTTSISSYTGSMNTVFASDADKWYKLNNLNEYEEYGLYGSGLSITTYEGKLTIYDGYEYIYSGGSWVSVGEVSGSTATLPNVPFVLNYNAKDYDTNTHTISKTSGQTKEVDAVCTYNTNNVVDHSSDGYISITGNTRFVISGGTTSLIRTNTETGCTMTIVSKVKTSSGYSILTSRGGTTASQMHWMWRYLTNGIFLHGSSSYNTVTYSVNTTSEPITASVRVNWNNGVQQVINDWTNNGSYSGAFQYGSSSSINNDGSLFCDYLTANMEFWKGDFYWVYMSQSTLTDEQIQQVIAFNESGETKPEYPMYYAELQDPPQNLVFYDIREANNYECPYVGLYATIGGVDYLYCETDEWMTLYDYVEVVGDYICEDGNKYKKLQEYERNIDGTMQPLLPPIYTKGDLIEEGSDDCNTSYENQYLTFVAETDGVTFTLAGGNSSNVFQYSLDNGSTWNNLQIGQTSPAINTNEKILWKASGQTINNNIGIGTIRPSAAARVQGNIMSMCYGDNFSGQTTIPANFQLRNMFSAATNITSAENLVFPATTVTKQCYSQMFQGCTGLTVAPKIIGTSATTFNGDYCWSDMFHNCTSLTTAPILPAATLGNAVYWAMFEGCTNLSNVTCLATSKQSNSTGGWLSNVASSGTFTKAPNTTIWASGANGIPNGWTVVEYGEDDGGENGATFDDAE